MTVKDEIEHGDHPNAEAWGPASNSLKMSSKMIGIWQLVLIVLLASYGNIPAMTSSDPGTITQGYQYYIGVEIMM